MSLQHKTKIYLSELLELVPVEEHNYTMAKGSGMSSTYVRIRNTDSILQVVFDADNMDYTVVEKDYLHLLVNLSRHL